MFFSGCGYVEVSDIAGSWCDDVARAAGPEGLYVVDELIGEALNCLLTGLGDVRGENKIRPRWEPHQRMVGRRRLLGGDVKTGAANSSLIQRSDKGLFIDQPTPRSVDEQRPALHQSKLAIGDHVFGRRHQRAVERNDIACSHDFVKRRVERAHPAGTLVGREQDAHPEGAPEVRDGSAEGSIANDPERRSSEIADREIEEAELSGLLPAAPG